MEDSLFPLEMRIAKFLRLGVIVSGVFLFAGWMTQIQLKGNPFQAFREYRPEPFVESVERMGAQGQWGLILCTVGLVALISLPTLRVLMTVVLFLKQRQYGLAGAAIFVLIALLFSFSLGIEI